MGFSLTSVPALPMRTNIVFPHFGQSISTAVPASPLQSLRPQTGQVTYFIITFSFSPVHKRFVFEQLPCAVGASVATVELRL